MRHDIEKLVDVANERLPHRGYDIFTIICAVIYKYKNTLNNKFIEECNDKLFQYCYGYEYTYTIKTIKDFNSVYTRIKIQYTQGSKLVNYYIMFPKFINNQDEIDNRLFYNLYTEKHCNIDEFLDELPTMASTTDMLESITNIINKDIIKNMKINGIIK